MSVWSAIVVLFALVQCSYTAPSAVTIDPLCYNPSGKDCTWYAKCINKKHPCPFDNYAMQYANYFCEKFGNDYNTYSTKGKQWIDRTRKCLQRILVPFLDNFTTCPKLKQAAFDSHTCCYLAGKECTPVGERHLPSICDIPLSDWLRVSWTIRDAFNVFSAHSDVLSTLKGGLGVLKGCASHHLGDERARRR